MATFYSNFTPGDFVCVTLFGLKYAGRVMEVHFTPGGATCLVRYADDKGDLCTGSFCMDEIEAVE